MNNNDIFKKLRVALQLRDEQIIEIMMLVDFRISKSELAALFRNADHPNYMDCGDQVLRNFLNGLVIHLRGTKENPKNAMDVINQNREAVQALEGDRFPRDLNTKNAATGNTKPAPRPRSKSEQSSAKPFKKQPAKKPAPKIEVVEKVRYNNGKKK